MAELRLSVRSHHFVVDRMSPQGREVVEKFARQFIQYGRRRRGRRYISGRLHDYFAWREDHRECRFHINVLERFEQHLVGCGIGHESLIERIEEPVPVAREINVSIRDRWTLRDYQEPAVDYITADGEPRSRFIGLQTGKGKGIVSLFGISRLRLRTLIEVLPKYIEKWVLEIREICDVELEDVMVVRGVRHLKALLAMAASGTLHSPIVIISSKTLQRWINVYERHGETTLQMGYACLPDQLMGWLGAGLRLIDEVHEHFSMQFRFDLYTHCQRSLSLSATLLHSDGFLNRMYEIAYPTPTRYKSPAYDRYVRVTALFYRFRHPERIRYRDPLTKNYSHQRFELSVMKDPELLHRYLDLIDGIVRMRYLEGHIPGERLAVFFTTVAMCTRATEFFRGRHPHLDVRRYIEEDPFENAITPDIRSTTLLSGGTAIDIPNLTTVILAIALSSVQANLQVLGRLRRLTSGRVPEFIYLNCMDIIQHRVYHERKVELFRYRALHHDTEFIHSPI
ncbi:hypothetical protein HDG34_003300 [Paraburkholderia sp. HC6.4b]|uniref:hypothetical protein n=1 Tax=unclassified Paraburkholderia TaxID=2615204 RepID=UPI00160EFE96|nr:MULTISPECIES: hypothetical protein [unclassified Paraburkholderia]MBB5409359.1 hypothetical protein [Paraburkholderia sp. HC6.4b]MBB5451087.1 hypothetical protein [Paraburkholderia sp. Kb1A]